jgi:hypothetical protein
VVDQAKVTAVLNLYSEREEANCLREVQLEHLETGLRKEIYSEALSDRRFWLVLLWDWCLELGKFEVFQQIGTFLACVIRTEFGLLLILSIGTCQLNDIKRVQILRYRSRTRS